MNPFVTLWSRKRVLKKGRLTSCMILIALVMAPLVCALIFSDSMMEGITSKYIYLSDGHLQVSWQEGGKDLSGFDSSGLDDMVYSVDEVFIDATHYLSTYKMTAHEFAMTMIRDVMQETRITATAGIGTNMYLAKVAMDIVAKHMPADKDGVKQKT